MVGGSANVHGQGSANVTVNQFSQNAIINWHTFNIGAGERTQFIQPNASSVDPQPRDRRARAVADPRQHRRQRQVFVVNRDGIIFGPGAVINTARLPRDHQRHQERRLHGRALQASTSRAGRMPRSSTWARSRRRAAASRRWSRRACATPAPSRRRSARSALAAGNTFTPRLLRRQADHARRRRPDRRRGEGRGDRRDAEVAGDQYRQAQGERRTRRADRRGGAPRGRLGDQHQRA